MEWSRSTVLSFIEKYRTYDHLWDTKHPEYKDRDKRRDAMTELAAVFDTERSEVEKKIRNLQSQFGRELRLIKEYEDAGRTYTSKWFAFKSLMFLLTGTRRNFKLKKASSADEVLQVLLMHESEEKTNESNSHLPLPVKEEPDDFELTSYNGIDSRDEFFSPDQSHIPTRKRRLELKTDWDDEEYSLFGKQIALKLKKLPTAHSKIMVQHIINTVLFEAELGKYNYPKESEQGEHVPCSYSVPKSVIPSTNFNSSQGRSPGSHSFNSESLTTFPRNLSPSFAEEDQSVDI